MKKKSSGLKVVLILVLLIVVIILIVQNLNYAPIRVLLWGFSAPVIAIILVSLLVGFFIGLLVLSFASGSGKQKPPETAGDEIVSQPGKQKKQKIKK